MSAIFYLRTTKQDGEAILFIRVQKRRPPFDYKFSSNIKVDVKEWINSQKSARQLTSYRSQKPELFSKLDKISLSVDTLLNSNNFNRDDIKKCVYDIVYDRNSIQKENDIEQGIKPQEKRSKLFLTFIQQYIKDCETGKRLKHKSTLKVSFGTIKSYRGFAAQILAYQDSKKIILGFEDINTEFYNDFVSFLISKKYSPNTVGRMVKICKTMAYAAGRMKLLDNTTDIRENFNTTYKDVDNVYLTDKRIQELYDMEIVGHPGWEKARDVFVVGCLTGQRVSDYKRINSSMLVTLSDGNTYIKLRQEKTSKVVFIPLDTRVKKILERNEGFLPSLYDQKINEYIKKIGEKLGWTEKIAIDEQKGSMEYTKKVRFCDMVKTHTARRSFATNAYKRGVSLASIMAITGHSSEQQLKTYLKLTDEEKAVQANRELNPIMKIAK